MQLQASVLELTHAITIVVSSAPHGDSFRIFDIILRKKKMSWKIVTRICSKMT